MNNKTVAILMNAAMAVCRIVTYAIRNENDSKDNSGTVASSDITVTPEDCPGWTS